MPTLKCDLTNCASNQGGVCSAVEIHLDEQGDCWEYHYSVITIINCDHRSCRYNRYGLCCADSVRYNDKRCMTYRPKKEATSL